MPLADTDPWGALITDLHDAGQHHLAKRADALRREYTTALRDAVGLLHTDAIPEAWQHRTITLTDATTRLREYIPDNSVGAPH